ncbi:MAG TPA: methyltransferase domain-containing protein [Bryobacteraceae bacterium]|jgi:ubiquinone/menaquinone biosynthesis C-methylase UbiE|nr:methyltransferase domain-containing protein [Bryobacteraceae bacterium]
MKKSIAFLALAAGALYAQVAQQANSTYQTVAGRENVAKSLNSPERESTEKPEELVRSMGLEPGMTVADIGTGPGFMLPYLSRRVGAGGHVLAEDIFDNFLADAKKNAAQEKLANVSFIKGTETDPNLPEGKVDMELVLDAYHHFDYPDKMLAALRRGLKPDGKLVIVDYYKREGAMPNGRALTHIRLDMPDVIKEVEANHFHLIVQKEHIKNVQYMLILEKS